MIRGRTRYVAPRDPAEAVAALADPRAVAIGGGTMILPELGQQPARERVLVDLGRAGLDRIAVGDDGQVTLGAMVSYRRLLEHAPACAAAPQLAGAAGGITGGASIRGQGTIGGSAAYANPSSDVPACLVAADARLRVLGPDGTREIAAQTFFAGAFETALRDGELLTEIVLPPAAGAAWGYHKLKLCEGSWPIATAACTLPDGVGAVRFALGGVAAVPATFALARERCEDPEALTAAARAAIARPWDDALADGAYRLQVAGVVARRAYEQARERLEGRG